MTTMTMTIDKEKLRAHAEQEIDYLIDQLYAHANNELGVALEYGRSGPRITGNCPCVDHPGDRNGRSFNWRGDTGRWVCWSHHCEQDYGTDIIGLTMSVMGIDFVPAMRWIEQTLIDRGTDPTAEIEIREKIDASVPKKQRPMDETKLAYLEPGCQWLTEFRNFDPDILARYEVGEWHQHGTYMHNRVVFPVRDGDGHLVGFSGRTLLPDGEWERQDEPKWKHGRYFDRFDELLTGSVLYNLNNAKDHMGSKRRLILVEGPLDGMRMEEAGIQNWVACLGCGFGPAHRTLLVDLGVNELDIALDPDTAGQKATERVTKLVADFFHVRRVELPQDPGDCSAEQLQEVWPL